MAVDGPATPLVDLQVDRDVDVLGERDRVALQDPDVAGSIQEGLDRAGRCEPETRRVRAVLAFGQLEYLAKRWLRVGWAVDREICLRSLTDSWCYLLASSA